MISGRDRDVFRLASEVAHGGTHTRVRVGAVVSKGHRTISLAHNLAGPVPNVQHYIGHAERRVLHTAVNKSTLYVARLGLNGDLLPSHPCPECMVAIELQRKITKLVYWTGTELVKEKINAKVTTHNAGPRPGETE